MKDILVMDTEAFKAMIQYIDTQLIMLDNFNDNKETMKNMFDDIEDSKVLYEYNLMVSKLINMVDDYYKMVKKAVNALYTIGTNLSDYDRTVYVHTTLTKDYDMIEND
ncbi:MAG: hypothetical protein E7257_08580 [Lachnospiraceae bacterium]|nr:hypothetical protein [Lachnospiraceae bacterium]MBQ9935244.1 hypothetical protein [Lachnospiraceae bacterium]